MYRVVFQNAGAGNGKIHDAFIARELVQISGKTKRRGRAQHGSVGFRQFKHPLGGGKIFGEGLVHINALSAHEGFFSKALMLFSVIRRKNNQNVGFLNHFFAACAKLNAELFAPLLAEMPPSRCLSSQA